MSRESSRHELNLSRKVGSALGSAEPILSVNFSNKDGGGGKPPLPTFFRKRKTIFWIF